MPKLGRKILRIRDRDTGDYVFRSVTGTRVSNGCIAEWEVIRVRKPWEKSKPFKKMTSSAVLQPSPAIVWSCRKGLENAGGSMYGYSGGGSAGTITLNTPPERLLYPTHGTYFDELPPEPEPAPLNFETMSNPTAWLAAIAESTAVLGLETTNYLTEALFRIQHRAMLAAGSEQDYRTLVQRDYLNVVDELKRTGQYRDVKVLQSLANKLFAASMGSAP